MAVVNRERGRGNSGTRGGENIDGNDRTSHSNGIPKAMFED